MTFALVSSAALVGFLHTIFGPDHYLPFVALAHAGRWRTQKTMLVTFVCGVGHILGALMIGWLGVALGSGVVHVAKIESARNEIAAWVFILFGLAYLIWGLRKARQQNTQPSMRKLGQILFVIFVVGPCEPLIPLLIFPAVQRSPNALFMLSGIFGAVTIATMMGMVALLLKGVTLTPMQRQLRFAHAWAGLVLIFCGVAMKFGL
jgi:nickel/cobalt transporter (NicO) family protein